MLITTNVWQYGYDLGFKGQGKFDFKLSRSVLYVACNATPLSFLMGDVHIERKLHRILFTDMTLESKFKVTYNLSLSKVLNVNSSSFYRVC